MTDGMVSVRKVGGAYLICNLEFIEKPKFLARNPNDGGLFLLIGEYPTYFLFRGDEQNGLKRCENRFVQPFADCIAIMFMQDGEVIGEITEPDNLDEGGQPVFNEFGADNLVKLEVLPHQVVR